MTRLPGEASTQAGATPDRLVGDLHRRARAERWGVSVEAFGEALARSAERSGAVDVERYLRGLHLEDLALACACAEGSETAWDEFVLEYRPVLYRAADALDPSGGGREIADALYAELFGVRDGAIRTDTPDRAVTEQGTRRSLFTYFHGRSSLGTWLRAVLSQRYVDRIRATRRTDPLPDDSSPTPLAAPPAPEPDPDRTRLPPLVWQALRLAIEGLAPRDRLRFACYHADGLTLAETGRILGEHEATASRQLTKTRRAIRQDVEQRLREDHNLSDAEVARAFECVVDEAGTFDLDRWASRKDSLRERSN